VIVQTLTELTKPESVSTVLTFFTLCHFQINCQCEDLRKQLHLSNSSSSGFPQMSQIRKERYVCVWGKNFGRDLAELESQLILSYIRPKKIQPLVFEDIGVFENTLYRFPDDTVVKIMLRSSLIYINAKNSAITQRYLLVPFLQVASRTFQRSCLYLLQGKLGKVTLCRFEIRGNLFSSMIFWGCQDWLTELIKPESVSTVITLWQFSK
jgi:hypothetical protein